MRLTWDYLYKTSEVLSIRLSTPTSVEASPQCCQDDACSSILVTAIDPACVTNPASHRPLKSWVTARHPAVRMPVVNTS